MPLVSQRIDNLLNGVSGQPEALRASSQGTSQVNALDGPRGKQKRPPSVHVSKIDSDPSGYDSAFIHDIHREEDEKYRLIVANGAVRAYDLLTGDEYPVNALPGASAYLTDGDFRALTLGDSTVLVNRRKTVGHLLSVTPAPVHEALVYVRQADFATSYIVSLDGVRVAFATTPASSPQAREKINTDTIATTLFQALVSNLSGTYQFAQYGSAIHMTRVDGKDFTVTTSDGLGDQGLRVVKGAVQSFEDLPYRARNGMVVEITGAKGSSTDNYWVRYDDTDSARGDGVWRECAKPGVLTSLDPATMPHLVSLGGRYMEETKCSPAPASPLVVEGETTFVEMGYTEAPTGAVDEDTSDYLTEHGEWRRATIAAGAERVVLPYRIDTSAMQSGSTVSVVVKRVGGAGEELDRRTILAGKRLNGAFALRSPLLAGEGVETRLEYDAGETPASSSRTAALTLPGRVDREPVNWSEVQPPPWDSPNDPVSPGGATSGGGGTGAPHPPPEVVPPPDPEHGGGGIGGGGGGGGGGSGVMVPVLVSRRIAFDPAAIYPSNLTLTVTVGAETRTFSTGATRVTGEALASAMATQVEGMTLFTGSTISPGLIEVRAADAGYVPAVTVSITWDSATRALLVPKTLTSGSLVGKVVKNLTDGSNGTVTANDADTLTATLTGGSDNHFEDGDVLVVVGTGTYFTFGPAPWATRDVGDLDLCPWPSFLGRKITEPFFTEGRLGFVSGESVILSASGDLFRFFRQTITDLLADDYIDVSSAHPEISNFHSVLLWNEGVYLFSDKGQFRLDGEPVLTPTTVQLRKVSSYENSSRVRPLAAGGRLFLTRKRGGACQVMEYQHPQDYAAFAEDISLHIPRYIRGGPLDIVGDGALGFVALLSDDDRRSLYIFSYVYGGNGERLQASWGRWDFPLGTTILYATMSGGVLSMVCKRADGVYLEAVDLSEEADVHLDRRFEMTAGTYNGSVTSWALPYSAPVDSSEGEIVVVRQDTGEELVCSRPSASTVAVAGNYSAVAVSIGVRYTWEYTPTTLFLRDEAGRPVLQGRLTVRYVDIGCGDATGIETILAVRGRADNTSVLPAVGPDGDSIRVPVHAHNTDVTLTLRDSTSGPCTLLGLAWEGTYINRSKAV